MNYLAHAHRFLERPWFALGTLVPDFMNMVDRRARARRRQAAGLVSSADKFVGEIAAGVVQHHDDDHRFHNSSMFIKLQDQLSQHLRTTYPDPRGLRSWFVAHISIEMLLDRSIMEQQPALLDRLYQIFAEVDRHEFRHAVESITGRELPKFEPMHSFFLNERFLYDYKTDAGLFYRINRILVRVGLEPFHPEQIAWLPVAARLVTAAREQLLDPVHGRQE
ncbi:MAG: hypothetical protein JNL67_03250 [Planctomycetaceae bacterium]|nr:hypothetical protein [Planctomycetaceae bacterium]